MRIAVALWGSVLAASPPSVELTLSGQGAVQRSPLELVRWLGDQGGERSNLTLAAEGHATAPLACEPGWNYQVRSLDLYSVPFELEAGDCSGAKTVRPIPVELVPGAEVRARLRPGSGTLPRVAQVVARRCGEAAGFLASGLIAPDGALSVTLPIGCLDVGVSVAGFAPVRRAALALQVSRPFDLGRIDLESDGSVRIRAMADWNGRPVAGARLGLVPEANWENAADRALAGEVVPMWQSSPSADDGIIEGRGLPAGRYGAILLGADATVGALALPPFAVTSGKTADLGEGRLPAAATLELDIDGSLEKRLSEAPGDWRWQVLVARDVSCDARSGERPARAIDPEQVSVIAVAPGKWIAQLGLLSADGRIAAVDRQAVAVAPGELARVRFDATIRLFLGSVHHNGKGIQADVELRPEGAYRGTVPWTQSQEDGRFAIVVPQKGRYDAIVGWRQEGTLHSARIADIGLDDPEEEIELRVPDGTIAGIVVDEAGAPVGEASVQATPPIEGVAAPPAGSRTNHSGAFAIEGLTPGRWTVVAHGTGRASRPTLVQVEATGQSPALELVLEPVRHIRGRLLMGDRALARVHAVLGIAPTAEAPLGSWIDIDSDDHGAFDVELPAADVRRALLMLPPPAPVVTARWLEVIGEEPVDVVLPTAVGDLSIEPATDGAWSAALGPSDLLLVAPDGAAVLAVGSGQGLLVPGPGTRTPWNIRGLAAGSWQLVELHRTPGEMATLLAGRAAELPRVGEIYLRSFESSKVEVK